MWYDQKQMQKVINNLLSNAIKHTEAEDTITLSVKKEENNVVIRVKDTGSGIDAKEIDKIFDRFYQIDPINSTECRQERYRYRTGLDQRYCGITSWYYSCGKRAG